MENRKRNRNTQLVKSSSRKAKKPRHSSEKFWSREDSIVLDAMDEAEVPVWKKCARFFDGATPMAVLDGLTVQTTSTITIEKDGKEVELENTNWPQRFCRQLAKILCCPVFYSRADLLRHAILSAVSQRVGQQQLVDDDPPQHSRNHEVMQRMYDADIEFVDDEMDNILNAVLGPEMPKHMEFLMFLPSVVNKQSTASESSQLEHDAYGIKVGDLEALTSAWDQYAKESRNVIELKTMAEYKAAAGSTNKGMNLIEVKQRKRGAIILQRQLAARRNKNKGKEVVRDWLASINLESATQHHTQDSTHDNESNFGEGSSCIEEGEEYFGQGIDSDPPSNKDIGLEEDEIEVERLTIPRTESISSSLLLQTTRPQQISDDILFRSKNTDISTHSRPNETHILHSAHATSPVPSDSLVEFVDRQRKASPELGNSVAEENGSPAAPASIALELLEEIQSVSQSDTSTQLNDVPAVIGDTVDLPVGNWPREMLVKAEDQGGRPPLYVMHYKPRFPLRPLRLAYCLGYDLEKAKVSYVEAATPIGIAWTSVSKLYLPGGDDKFKQRAKEIN